MIRGIVGIKHFYLDKVCKHLRHMFLKVVSYNRVVKLEKETAFPLALFIQKMLYWKACRDILHRWYTSVGMKKSTNRYP